MKNNIDVQDILNSLEAVEDLYSPIPIEILKNEKEETSFTENADKKNSKNLICEKWGNQNASFLILGTDDDNSFSKNDILWKNILELGMNLKENEVFCVKLNDSFDEDIKNYKSILCLGEKARFFLEGIFKDILKLSKMNVENKIIIMPTFSIDDVKKNMGVKKIFWRDLKIFLKEIENQ